MFHTRVSYVFFVNYFLCIDFPRLWDMIFYMGVSWLFHIFWGVSYQFCEKPYISSRSFIRCFIGCFIPCLKPGVSYHNLRCQACATLERYIANINISKSKYQSEGRNGLWESLGAMEGQDLVDDACLLCCCCLLVPLS